MIRVMVNQNWLFPSSLEEAKEIQCLMAKKVIVEDDLEEPQWVGGMDVSCNLYDPTQMIYAATVVLDYKTVKLVDQAAVIEKQTFSYIPGLLGFREAPALVHAFNKLQRRPDILMVDGHGISHPRGLGIASHLGVLLDIPTIGVAKSILIGRPAKPLPLEVGSLTPLLWKGKQIAMLYRTKARANPLIISTGHRISLETAVKFVARTLRGYRLPEPTRQAHLAANACRIKNLSGQ